MVWNRTSGIIRPATWKVIDRPWRTLPAPILTNPSRSLVGEADVPGSRRSTLQATALMAR